MLKLKKKGLRPLIVGHRGARSHAPENTLASFKKGIALGADLVECDIHMTRDAQIVVIHDDTTERTTGQPGRVDQMTLSQIKSLDAGDGEKIPTLAELLDWVMTQPSLGIAVEIKKGIKFYPEILAQTYQLIQKRNLLNRVILISFDPETLSESKKLYPELATGFLYEDSSGPSSLIETALSLKADVIGPCVATITPESVENAHKKGLGVFTWTANTPESIHRAIQCGVDAIASDAPDRVKSLIPSSGL